MDFIPIEDLDTFAENKYEAIIIAAKEARRLNILKKEGKIEGNLKPTILALKKLKEGKLKYKYEKSNEDK
ncbi:MAG: DNA-directed RNA polymerase subunit omega [Candidatus Edwardsbacteria bacterium]